jgi:ribosomal protein RSM22 (predicted rRNA methylase)
MLPPLFNAQFEAYRSAHPLVFQEVKARWEALSAAYRQRQGNYTQKAEDHMAYIMARMPATFAACEAVLSQAIGVGLQPPATALDIGAGPGTMGWALSQLDNADQMVLTQVEKDSTFAAFCAQVRPPLKQVQTVSTFLGNEALSPHGWVSLAYVLCELAPGAQANWVERAFALTQEALILIEPGTPAGYRRILAARDQLISLGGHVVAPCPHQAACPLAKEDWCHFPARFQRTPEGRQLKHATLPYEEFSYLIVVKDPSSLMPYPGRVIRHPMPRSGHIHLDICTSQGAYEKVTISAKSKDVYKTSRSLKWGDVVPFELPSNVK